MNSKIEFVLKPVTGAASAKGGYHAILTTAKGDAMDSTPFGRGAKTIWPWRGRRLRMDTPTTLAPGMLFGPKNHVRE